MKMRFLLDENMNPRIKKAVLHRVPTIDILLVGEPEAPPLSSPDPDILRYLEVHQRALITDNRRSMPLHFAAHMQAGHSHWGIFIVSARTSIGMLATEIEMLWEASEAAEWVDCLQRLPL